MWNQCVEGGEHFTGSCYCRIFSLRVKPTDTQHSTGLVSVPLTILGVAQGLRGSRVPALPPFPERLVGDASGVGMF